MALLISVSAFVSYIERTNSLFVTESQAEDIFLNQGWGGVTYGHGREN